MSLWALKVESRQYKSITLNDYYSRISLKGRHDVLPSSLKSKRTREFGGVTSVELFFMCRDSVLNRFLCLYILLSLVRNPIKIGLTDK